MATQTVTAARALPPPRGRKATTVVLTIGSLIALVAAFGPVWVVRGGLVVAIAAAVATTMLAWREVAADRRAHAAATLAASKAHGDTLRIERSHNSAVLQVVTDRSVAALAEITRQQALVAQLRGEISSLKGDRIALTAEISRREAVIADLHGTVRSREAELVSARAAAAAAEAAAAAAAEREAANAAARAEDQAADRAAAESPDESADENGPETADESAEVHAMPRRMLLEGEEQPRRGSDADPRRDVSTVVDLDANGLDRGPERRDLAAGFAGSSGAGFAGEPILPNYEEDRRLA